MTRTTTKDRPQSTPSEGLEGIDRTVERYATGLRDGDVQRLKEAFRPEAIVSGYIGTELFVKPVEFLYEYVRQNESPAKRGDAFTYRIDNCAVAGHTAVVTLTERAYLGYDYRTNLQMIEIGERWWIVSKLFNGTGST